MIKSSKVLSTSDIKKVEFCEENGKLVLSHSGISLPISLGVYGFELDKELDGFKCEIINSIGDTFSDEGLETDFSPIKLKSGGTLSFKVNIKWLEEENVLRKYVKYKFDGISDDVLVKEIILEQINFTDSLKQINTITVNGASYPVLFDGFFAGIEYPAATTQTTEKGVKISHAPGIRALNGEWYESRTMVCGVAPLGKVNEKFLTYIADKAFKIDKLHINYNGWWTMPYPFTEDLVLDIMKEFKNNLGKYGANFDSFTIDMGWSDSKTIWGISREMFPEGFTKLYNTAQDMNSDLGLWISPTACYNWALDNQWANEQGYETFSGNCCLGGEKYREAFKKSLNGIVKDYHINHVKLDGACLKCDAEGHGHEAGALSTEKIVEGFVSILTALKQTMPTIWMESTCFGFNPSPWWLLYVSSVLGTYGDDAQCGRVPCPTYRESYTTSRDFFNLQGIGRICIPIRNQELLGIAHQTEDDFTNDAIVTLLRGNMFMPAYINPKFMNDSRWSNMAKIFNWGRKNEKVLLDTQVIFPKSWMDETKRPMMTNDAIMPRDPYGYAHWIGEGSLVLLRNPWIEHKDFALKIPDNFTDADKTINIVSIFPEVRTYVTNVKSGDIVNITLLPYETVVLSFEDQTENARDEFQPPKEINVLSCDYQLAETKAENKLDNPTVKFTSEVEIISPKAKLLFLMEADKSPFNAPEGTVNLNGKEASIKWTGTDDGWSATGLKKIEHWVFGIVELENGINNIVMEVKTNNQLTNLSCWIWGYKNDRNDEFIHQNALPSPEIISVDSILLSSENGEH